MIKNMGILDRTLRTIVGIAVVALYFTGHLGGTLGIVLLVFAGIFILTSFISFCPLYTLFGFSTGKKPAA